MHSVSGTGFSSSIFQVQTHRTGFREDVSFLIHGQAAMPTTTRTFRVFVRGVSGWQAGVSEKGVMYEPVETTIWWRQIGPITVIS